VGEAEEVVLEVDGDGGLFEVYNAEEAGHPFFEEPKVDEGSFLGVEGGILEADGGVAADGGDDSVFVVDVYAGDAVGPQLEQVALDVRQFLLEVL
jgi:hypothetical protein